MPLLRLNGLFILLKIETVTLNVMIRICPILHDRENKVSASNFEEKTTTTKVKSKQIKNTTNNEKPSDRPPETSRERKCKIPDDQNQNQKRKNQNQNSFLVKRQNDKTSPGLCRGRFVPSSHKGSEFRYAIVRQFSRGGVIPVPDSFGKEAFAFLIDLFTSRGNLKGH